MDIGDLVNKIKSYGLNHDQLKVLTIIEGIAVNETPIRIGKGRGELGESDSPILRDLNGVPYIPGSSLKGALRAFAEALVRGSGGRVCTPFDPDCVFGAELLNYILQLALTSTTIDEVIKRIERNRVREIARRRLGIENIEKVDEVINKIWSQIHGSSDGLITIIDSYAPCPICRLFGNGALASRVIIFDMYPENVHSVRVGTRVRTAIDRLREAARSGALFDYEYIPLGYRWKFRMEIKNLDLLNCHEDECILLRKVIKFFAIHGISMGSMKSVGHGLLKLLHGETRIDIYRVEGFDINKSESIVLGNVIERW